MWTCKHCCQEFDFKTINQKANHSRWCDSNPKSQFYRDGNKTRALLFNDDRHGELKTFTVVCATCSTPIDVEERELSFPKQDKYFCSRSCANATGGRAKADLYYPDDVAGYRTVCFRYHKHECVVCGFDKIVDVHHLDEDHNNNDPKNLVPLCSNHHNMWHSRFKVEIKDKVREYVNTRWQMGV